MRKVRKHVGSVSGPRGSAGSIPVLSARWSSAQPDMRTSGSALRGISPADEQMEI